MNGTVTEKAFEEMTTDAKLWLLYNTMVTRAGSHKKHFKRIYFIIGVLFVSFAISNGGESLRHILKIVGIL